MHLLSSWPMEDDVPFEPEDEDAFDTIQGRLAEDIDRPVEDTVFLAPRLDFTPGGEPRGKGGGADIASPFAESEEKTVTELMSPVRRMDPDHDESAHVFEAKPLVDDIDIYDDLLEELAEPVNEPDRQERSFSPPIAFPAGRSSPAAPAPSRPRAPRPVLDQPVTAEPEALRASPLRRRPIDVDGKVSRPIDLSSLDLPSLKSRPSPPPNLPASDDGPLSRRRRAGRANTADESPNELVDETPDETVPERTVESTTDAAETTVDTGVAAPRRPARWKLATQAIAGGMRALLTGLGAVWAAYSRGCLALETRLSRLAGRTAAHIRWLLALTGSTVVRLGSAGLVALVAGAGHGWRLARTFAAQTLIIARKGLAAAIGTCRQVAAVTGPLIAASARTAGSMAVKTGSAAARGTMRGALTSLRTARAGATAIGGMAKSASARIAAKTHRADGAFAPTKPPEPAKAQEIRPPTTASAAAPPSQTKRAVATPPDPAKISAAADGRKEQKSNGLRVPSSQDFARQLSQLLSASRPEKLALTGLAAASVALLFVAFGPGPSLAPAHAELIFPIPEKPAAPGQSSALEITDPLAEIIDYVSARAPVQESAAAAGQVPTASNR